MTFGEIKYLVMFQTNNDADDIEDFTPQLHDYINEAYDRLVKVWAGTHTEWGITDYPRMANDPDIPKTPEWTHRYLADWATWLVYRNGNPQKQQRGIPFRDSFEGLLRQIADEGGADGIDEDGKLKKVTRFINIPE